MPHVPIPAGQALHSRFLYPFLYQEGDPREASESLLELTWQHRPVWKNVELHALYVQDALPDVASLLARNEDKRSIYMRLDRTMESQWFGNVVALADRMEPEHHAPGPAGQSVPAFLNTDTGVELFLSPAQGVGVLSLTFGPRCLPHDPGLSQAAAKQFNYKLAQLGRRNAALLRKPHPRWDPHLVAPDKSQLAEPPAGDAPLEERLGHYGGMFGLEELIRFLLKPLQDLHRLACVQSQLSLYTVLQFGHEVDFDTAESRHAFGPLLSALAQIEEPSHAPAPADHLPVANELLNSKHWAASSYMGSAHLIADQWPSEEKPESTFDEQRMQIVRDKYFSAFLLTLLQRLTLQSLHDEASAIAGQFHQPLLNGSGGQRAKLLEQFRDLRQRTLSFGLTGHFIEISNREAVNRYYEQAQRSQRVKETLAVVRSTVQAIDQANQAEAQGKSLDAMAGTQNKLEWIEIFLISFYAGELSKLMAEMFHFEHRYAQWSVVGWTFAAIAIGIYMLRPWQHQNLDPRRRLTVIVGAFLCWFLAGLIFFSAQSRPAALASIQQDAESWRKKAVDAPFSGVDPVSTRLRAGDTRMQAAMQSQLAQESVSAQRSYEEARQAYQDSLELSGKAAAADRARAQFERACPQDCASRQPTLAEKAKNAEILFRQGNFPGAERAWAEARQWAESRRARGSSRKPRG